jgi:1-phosphofructokinase
MDTSIYRTLGDAAHASGARWALDTSGDALLPALAAGPDVVKPNREELSEAVGADADTLGAVVEACHELRARGARTVVCSLGGDGAVLVDDEGAWHARGPVVQVRNTVGAGDALLAGFVHAGGQGPEALRVGVAWATAAVGTEGTGVPDPSLVGVDDVVVTDAPDLSLPLVPEVTP